MTTTDVIQSLVASVALLSFGFCAGVVFSRLDFKINTTVVVDDQVVTAQLDDQIEQLIERRVHWWRLCDSRLSHHTHLIDSETACPGYLASTPVPAPRLEVVR